jgi:glycosyltransferase involved in cell wall biosynthesis
MNGPPAGISVIVPVFNEEENLEPLDERIRIALESLDRPYEIVYVDDGSTDGSWTVLKQTAALHAHVRLVRLRKNFGQASALAAGFAHSRHPILVTLDADLQNDPSDIPRLVEALGEATDLVAGWRRHRQDPWLMRRVPSRVANVLTRAVTGLPLHDFGCTLRAYRREVIQDVRLFGEMHRFLPVLVAGVGGRIVEMEVRHHPRRHGVSKYGFFRTYKVIVDLLTLKFIGEFSSRPNYVFGGFGLTSFVLGLLALAVVAYRVLVLKHLEATPLVFFMVVFFLAGTFSIFIGFLAEMMIRAMYESLGRATYFVRETVGLDDRS